jgi:pantetheine-phosphate adenylyltransferase
MRNRAVYPGSFDPITLGHIDIIHRATAIFDRVIVAVASNEAKHPLFSVAERLGMIREAVASNPKVEIVELRGLLVDFARAENVMVLIRGLRAVSDFEFEFQMALMNRRLEPRLETIFLTPQEEHTFLSSRIVKEVARLGGDVSAFVPPHVAAKLEDHRDPGV